MTSTTTEPMSLDWTREAVAHSESGATASAVNERLAQVEVAQIDDRLVPYLAAAAAELALLADIPWRFSADDPPVALLRMIARANLHQPTAGGPHTARLLQQLG